ncbi:MAG: hypothetical protein HY314_01445 [Acidobacteria bacterium]|nr:hypothetical protein [Acidobacteriota bacterium]
MKRRKIAVVVVVVVPLVLAGYPNGVVPVLTQSHDGDGVTTQVRLSVESLTYRLAVLNAEYQRADPARRSQLLDDLLTVAVSRQQLLAALIQKDPGQALRVAVPAELRDRLPLAVRAYVEEKAGIEGVFEILCEDRDQESHLLYFLKADRERLSLRFAVDPPTQLQTGSQIRVKGLRVQQTLVLESGGTDVETLLTALPKTAGEQRTLVILVNFQNKPNEQPYTIDDVRSVMFNATSDFYRESSYDQMWLNEDVYGWYTISLNSTVCDPVTIATYAQSAAIAAGVDLSAYTRYVYAFPKNTCSWWGLATIGGDPSETWINGKFQLKVVGHELGHNLGLYHSRALACSPMPIGDRCTLIEYGDTLDIMGNPSSGHFNAFQKERLGWLNDSHVPPILTVQAEGTYWLSPYESVGSHPNVLKILRSTDPDTGKKTWYYVEYRQAIGFDGFLFSNSNVPNGVVIHTGSELTGNSSDLLDMTPETASRFDPALIVGKSFNDPKAGVTITPVSVSSAGASVNVTFGL